MNGSKLIIDCDPGIDDAVALTLALFDPRLEVVAATACSGTVDAVRSTRNLQAIVEQLDPPRHPRLGEATDQMMLLSVMDGIFTATMLGEH